MCQEWFLGAARKGTPGAVETNLAKVLAAEQEKGWKEIDERRLKSAVHIFSLLIGIADKMTKQILFGSKLAHVISALKKIQEVPSVSQGARTVIEKWMQVKVAKGAAWYEG